MGIEEAPQSRKIKIPSFEDFKNIAGEIFGLHREAHAAVASVRQWRYGTGAGETAEYGGKPNEWESIPEMADLFAEQQDLLASSVSEEEIKKYSTLYQRVFERAMGLMERSSELEKQNEFVYNAIHDFFRRSEWPSEEELQAAYDKEAKWERHNIDRMEAEGIQESPEFREAQSIVKEAMRFMSDRSRWEWSQKRLQEKGFATPEEMLANAIKKLSEIKKAVGEENFNLLSRFTGDRDMREALKEVKE